MTSSLPMAVPAAACVAACKGDCLLLEAALTAQSSLANERSAFGGTPLHYAIVFGRDDALKILLKHQANVAIRTADERSPLLLLLQYRHYFKDPVQACKGLVDAGADYSHLPDKISKLFPGEYVTDLRLKEMEKLIEKRLPKVCGPNDFSSGPNST